VGQVGRVGSPVLWPVLAYLCAAIVGLALSAFVVRIPVQLSDGLANLIQVQEGSWFEVVKGGVASGYMRPALWLQFKVAFHAAAGHYTGAFRAIHAVQIVSCALLFVGALRVRSAAALCTVPFGLALLFGLQTFDGTIREAYPLNTYLTVVLSCLAAFTLANGRFSRVREATAVALFVLMLFTVETGVLVGVVLAASWAMGARGISRRTVVICGAVLAGYVVSRAVFLGGATPGLTERTSGFGFGQLEPQQIQERFGAFPYGFYLYNVASQLLTVLAGEPSGGVFAFTGRLLAGTLRPAQIIYEILVIGSTASIAVFARSRWSSWRRREFTHADRLVLVFAGVLAVNAVVSFPYTKDVIMSPAGVFFALAAAVSVERWLSAPASRSRAATAAVSLMLALLSTAAAVRLLAVHYQMRSASFVTRNDWIGLGDWADRNHVDLSRPARATLANQLQHDALNQRVPAPRFTEREAGRFLPYLF